MTNEIWTPNPEAAFDAAVSSLRREQSRYTRRSWIVDEGNPWKDGKFNPDAYDPRFPYVSRGGVYILETNPTQIIEDPFDLDNLRIFEKEKVEDLLRELQGKAADTSKQGVVAMIGTGGTIASHEETRLDGTKIRVAGLSVDYLLSRTGGGLQEKYGIASADFPTLIDSSQMEIDYNAELVIVMSYIWKNATALLKSKFNGFIVAHGTDTMSGSSSYTAMMLGPNCPFSVGFVGGQKDIEADFTDARSNLENAFTTLKMLKEAKVAERFVSMGGNAGGAYLTVGVQKESDTLVESFISPSHQLLVDASDFASAGIQDSFQQAYQKALHPHGPPNYDMLIGSRLREQAQLRYFQEFRPIILRGYAPFIRIKPEEGDDPEDYYEQIKGNNRARAVLLTTFGTFTANSKIRRAIMEAARETEKVVFAANPFPGGRDDHEYKDAVDLREAGVHVTTILPTALGAKITLASYLFGNNPEAIAKFVADYNYVGEQPRSTEDLGIRPEWMNVLKSGKIPQETTR